MRSTRINTNHNIMSVITHKVSDYHFHQGDAGFEAVSRAGPELGAGAGAGDWTPTSVALDFRVSAIVVCSWTHTTCVVVHSWHVHFVSPLNCQWFMMLLVMVLVQKCCFLSSKTGHLLGIRVANIVKKCSCQSTWEPYTNWARPKVHATRWKQVDNFHAVTSCKENSRIRWRWEYVSVSAKPKNYISRMNAAPITWWAWLVVKGQWLSCAHGIFITVQASRLKYIQPSLCSSQVY
jgi:hypothetical protein